ncbi:Uncharacterized protein Fot_03073 [Forsythia ovata]|uniref:Uncharacterized protein n=1 Tax=Forsythia ovata TaxID=205694 RepID=A0ABD1X8U3_9LAMI
MLGTYHTPYEAASPMLGLGYSTFPNLGLSYLASLNLELGYSASPNLGLGYSTSPNLGLGYSASPNLGLDYSASPNLGLDYSVSLPQLGTRQFSLPHVGTQLFSLSQLGTRLFSLSQLVSRLFSLSQLLWWHACLNDSLASPACPLCWSHESPPLSPPCSEEEKIIYHQLAPSVENAQKVMARTRRARNVTAPPAPVGDVGTESNAATNHPQLEFASAAQLAALQAQVVALTALLQDQNATVSKPPHGPNPLPVGSSLPGALPQGPSPPLIGPSPPGAPPQISNFSTMEIPPMVAPLQASVSLAPPSAPHFYSLTSGLNPYMGQPSWMSTPTLVETPV